MKKDDINMALWDLCEQLQLALEIDWAAEHDHEGTYSPWDNTDRMLDILADQFNDDYAAMLAYIYRNCLEKHIEILPMKRRFDPITGETFA